MKRKRQVYNISIRVIIAAAAVLCLLCTALPENAMAAAPVISGSPPGGQVGTPYSCTFTATCGGAACASPTWSISGLPPGLIASGRTVSGTPTAQGTFALDVTVNDATGTATASFIIIITVPALVFSTTSIPGATVGQNYSATVTATGGTGTITYALSGGGLPSGLTFNAGQIMGTPARGAGGSYSFTVTATAGSTTAQQAFSLFVDKGNYNVTVSISTGLAEGQTRLYVDNVPKSALRGGESAKLTGLDPDSSVNVSVDSTVANPGRPDIRYKAEATSARASVDVSQIQFNYFTEYDVQVKSDPTGLTSIAGSGWYRDGTPLNINAPQEISRDAESQYRFAYWLTPRGDKINSQVLNTAVASSGNFVATYELYYKVNIESQFGSVQGGGWLKSGSSGKWSISPSEVAMPGILGFFGGKYKALLTSGTAVADEPRTVTVQWDPDYSTPAVTIPLLVLAIAGAVYGFYALSRRGRQPVPAPYATQVQHMPPPPIYYPPYQAPPPLPPPPPPPPQTTVVMIGDGLKRSPQNTREQLMEKFGELLQKYEDELSQGRELPPMPELNEMATVIEKKSLPSPDVFNATEVTSERPAPVEECGNTTKKLLRTVVTQWRNTSIKPIIVTPGDKKSAALAGGRTVTWTRETYNEWELHICKLPSGHKGTHKGANEVAYSLLDTINEERNYGPKQPLKPPAPHYTDGMPEVDIPASQIIPPDQLPA